MNSDDIYEQVHVCHHLTEVTKLQFYVDSTSDVSEKKSLVPNCLDPQNSAPSR